MSHNQDPLAHRMEVVGRFINKLRRSRGYQPLSDSETYKTVSDYETLLHPIPTEVFADSGEGSLVQICIGNSYFQAAQIWSLYQQLNCLREANANTRDSLALQAKTYEREPTGPGRERLRQFLTARGVDLQRLHSQYSP